VGEFGGGAGDAATVLAAASGARAGAVGFRRGDRGSLRCCAERQGRWPGGADRGMHWCRRDSRLVSLSASVGQRASSPNTAGSISGVALRPPTMCVRPGCRRSDRRAHKVAKGPCRDACRCRDLRLSRWAAAVGVLAEMLAEVLASETQRSFPALTQARSPRSERFQATHPSNDALPPVQHLTIALTAHSHPRRAEAHDGRTAYSWPTRQSACVAVMEPNRAHWPAHTASRSPWQTRRNETIVIMRVAAWRQIALARIGELQARQESIRATFGTGIAPGDEKLLDGVRDSLNAAKKEAKNTRLLSMISGASVEGVWSNVHEAEVVLLGLAPDEGKQLAACGNDVLAFAREHLHPNDPHLVALEKLVTITTPSESRDLNDDGRAIAAHTLRAAHVASTTEKMQARSFRNIVVAGVVLLLIMAVGLAAFGMNMPTALRLCFPSVPFPSPLASGLPICPTGGKTAGGWDVPLVEIIGLAAASLTAAVSLSKLDGTSTPYAIPSALTLLKLPAGAVSAVLGLALANGGLIPGLNPTTQGEILALAALFGAGQQALTRFVDAKGQEVLNNVRGPALGPGERSGNPSETGTTR
jgi:hypothetical protein